MTLLQEVTLPAELPGDNVHEVEATVGMTDAPERGRVLLFKSDGTTLHTNRRGQVDWWNFSALNKPYSLYFSAKLDGALEDLSLLSVFNGTPPMLGPDQFSLQFMVNLWQVGPRGDLGLHLLVFPWRDKTPAVNKPSKGAPFFPMNEWVDIRVDVNPASIDLYQRTDGGNYALITSGKIPDAAREHLAPMMIHGGLYGTAYIGSVWNGPITIRFWEP
jgi:hypothetical protein